MRLLVRDVKPLVALSALLVPLDLFAYGGNLGWGLHFTAGRWLTTAFGPRFYDLTELLGFGQQDVYLANLIHAVAAGTAALAALVAVLAWALRVRGGGLSRADAATGALFVLAGLTFLASRFVIYDWLLYNPNPGKFFAWSLPAGAAYLVFVGLLFYRDWWALGA